MIRGDKKRGVPAGESETNVLLHTYTRAHKLVCAISITASRPPQTAFRRMRARNNKTSLSPPRSNGHPGRSPSARNIFIMHRRAHRAYCFASLPGCAQFSLRKRDFHQVALLVFSVPEFYRSILYQNGFTRESSSAGD